MYARCGRRAPLAPDRRGVSSLAQIGTDGVVVRRDDAIDRIGAGEAARRYSPIDFATAAPGARVKAERANDPSSYRSVLRQSAGTVNRVQPVADVVRGMCDDA